MNYKDWRNVPLGKVCDIRRGSSPRPIIDFLANEGMPWVKIADATESKTKWIDKTNQFIKTEGVSKSVMVEPGDLILSNSGTAGLPKFMSIQACIHDGWQVLRNFRNITPDFTYYELLHIRSSLLHGAYDSSMKNLTLDMVRDYVIGLPSIEEQNSITNILSSLDDKIELNNNINKNLESIAQTLYKQWFVDFEFPNVEGVPYKSSGGEMIESKLGFIPKGWEVGNINDIGTVIGGGTPSRKREEFFCEEGIPWITPKDLSINTDIFVSKGQQDITDLGLSKSSAKLMPKGTILFSSRAPIGYLAIAQNDVCTNQGFKSVIPNVLYGTHFVYHLLKMLTPQIESVASGSTFKEISSGALKSISIVIPNPSIVSIYCDLVMNIYSKIESGENEVRVLRGIRNTLLPRLMSGEIRVPIKE